MAHYQVRTQKSGSPPASRLRAAAAAKAAALLIIAHFVLRHVIVTRRTPASRPHPGGPGVPAHYRLPVVRPASPQRSRSTTRGLGRG